MRRKTKLLLVIQDKLDSARFYMSRVLIWNAISRSAYKERDDSNQTIFDSYIKRKRTQNRYQLLRINLAILAFQFQEY